MANISVDFYGSLDKYTAFWREFLKFVILEGHKVYVISGDWEKPIIEKLEKLGFKPKIHVNGIISILQTLEGMGFKTWLDEANRSWCADNTAWWPSKAHICAERNIAVHFDDNIGFAKYFTDIPTRFIHTESTKGEAILKGWSNQLKMANTFGDWEDFGDYYGIGGVVPA